MSKVKVVLVVIEVLYWISLLFGSFMLAFGKETAKQSIKKEYLK